MITVFDLRDALKESAPPAMLQLSEFVYRLRKDPEWERRWWRLFKLALPLVEQLAWNWVDIICVAVIEASAPDKVAKEAFEQFARDAVESEADLLGVDEEAYRAFKGDRWWPEWRSKDRAWLSKS
jgi:hypothetical protein